MEKENMKTKKKKNNHEKLWKIIHVLSYILSITFIFFIIIACVEGCQQKSNNQQEHNNNKLVDKNVNNIIVNGNDVTLSNQELYDYLFVDSFYSYLDNNSFNQDVYTSTSSIYSYASLIYFYNTNRYTDTSSLNYINHYTSAGNKTIIFSNRSSWGVQCVTYGHKKITNDFAYWNAYTNNIANKEVTAISITFHSCSTSFKNFLNGYFNTSSGYTEEEMQEATSDAYENGYSEGVIEGNSEGYIDGYSEGYIEGNSEGYSNGNYDGYNSGYQIGYNDGLSVNAEEVTNITIQYDYDFRNLISDNIDLNTGLMRVSTSSEGLTTIETLSLSGLTFKVGDNLYNNVVIRTISLDQDLAIAFEDNLNTCRTASELYPNNDYYFYRGLVSVAYRYLDNDNNVVREQRIVNGYINYSGTNSSGIVVSGCFDFRTPTWVSNAFRFLTIEEDTGTKVSTPTFNNTFTLKELLSLEGNITMSTNNTTTMFSLFSMAFGSVAGILGIAVLPNITLGLLLFIPLIVGIIVLILKAIKK